MICLVCLLDTTLLICWSASFSAVSSPESLIPAPEASRDALRECEPDLLLWRYGSSQTFIKNEFSSLFLVN